MHTKSADGQIVSWLDCIGHMDTCHVRQSTGKCDAMLSRTPAVLLTEGLRGKEKD